MLDRRSGYEYEDLLACGRGEMFGPGNAQLPLPPMLMFDRITDIAENSGEYGKGLIRAELESSDLRIGRDIFLAFSTGNRVQFTSKLQADGTRTPIDYDFEVAAAKRLKPNIVLCDIGLPGFNGFEVVRASNGRAALAAVGAWAGALVLGVASGLLVLGIAPVVPALGPDMRPYVATEEGDGVNLVDIGQCTIFLG